MSVAHRYLLTVPLVIVVVAGTAAWAAHNFTDVPDDHPQHDDIAYAAEKGWFAGYGDGTFRPDRKLTTDQAVTVFGRAFPDGVSRADLATILRAGDETLTGQSTTTTTQAFQPIPCENRQDSECVITDVRWDTTTRPGERWLVVEYQLTDNCHTRWDMTVQLVDTPGGGLVGDPIPRSVTGSWPGDALVVNLFDPTGTAQTWTEAVNCQAGSYDQPTDTSTGTSGEPWCNWQVCIDDQYEFRNAGVLYLAIKIRNQQLCPGYWSATVHLLDDNGRRTGLSGIVIDADGRINNRTATIEVRIPSGTVPAGTLEFDTACW